MSCYAVSYPNNHLTLYTEFAAKTDDKFSSTWASFPRYLYKYVVFLFVRDLFGWDILIERKTSDVQTISAQANKSNIIFENQLVSQHVLKYERVDDPCMTASLLIFLYAEIYFLRFFFMKF